MSENTDTGKCEACGGRLVPMDDYAMRRSLRTAAAVAPVAAVICAVWAPLFFLVRLAIGGALGDVGGGVLAVLVLKKILVGIILGLLLGAAAGVGRGEAGPLLAAVVGALGGFFIAAADSMPLKSAAEYRIDVVLVSVIAGILCVATFFIAEKSAVRRRGEWIGPEPVSGDEKSDSDSGG